MVANPFLALSASIPWFLVARYAFRVRNVPLILLTLACAGIILWLFQFHCLDCGVTRPLLCWKQHACERSTARYQSGTRRWPRGPNPVVQTCLWGLAVFVVVLFWLMSM